MPTPTPPVPTVTPYISPAQGGNYNVPIGQTGTPYSKEFIGPIQPQWAPVGAPVSSVQNPSYGQPYNLTPSTGSTGGNTGGSPAPSGIQTNQDAINAGFTGLNDYLDYLRQQQSQQGPSEADITNQINSAYNPAYQNLNAVEQQYRAEYPNAQATIENSFAQVKPMIEAEQTTKLGDLASQRTKGKQEEKNQFAAARQRYNEIRQGLLTRFGGASSTGEASQELLGRTTAEQIGQTQQNFGQLYQDIDKEEMNTKNFYMQKLTGLEQDKQNKLQTLKNDFDAAIRNINNQRATLDSEKAARRVAVLEQYAAQARQVQFDNQKLAQQLQLWMAAKEEAINTARQFQAKSFTIPGIPGVLGNFTVNTSNTGGGTTASQLESIQGTTGLTPSKVTYKDPTTGATYYLGGGTSASVLPDFETLGTGGTQ